MTRTMLSRDPRRIAEAIPRTGLSVLFDLDTAGAIGDEAVVFFDGQALARMPVPLLSRLADAFPEADTRALRDAVATFHAERAGLRGRA